MGRLLQVPSELAKDGVVPLRSVHFFHPFATLVSQLLDPTRYESFTSEKGFCKLVGKSHLAMHVTSSLLLYQERSR